MLQRFYENGQRCEYIKVANAVIVKVNLGKKLDEMFQLNRFDYMLQMFEQLNFRIQNLIKEHNYVIIQE